MFGSGYLSLKAIEMQVALPRTVDAAKMQEQLMQRGQLMNEQANMKVHEEEVKQRTTVVKQEHKDNAEFKKHGGNPEQPAKEKKERLKKTNQPLSNPHPYKGNFIDYSG
jgi:hypothetical protein